MTFDIWLMSKLTIRVNIKEHIKGHIKSHIGAQIKSHILIYSKSDPGRGQIKAKLQISWSFLLNRITQSQLNSHFPKINTLSWKGTLTLLRPAPFSPHPCLPVFSLHWQHGSSRLTAAGDHYQLYFSHPVNCISLSLSVLYFSRFVKLWQAGGSVLNWGGLQQEQLLGNSVLYHSPPWSNPPTALQHSTTSQQTQTHSSKP